MPIKLIGRTTDFKGKPLWEILGNLKNCGVGRLVQRQMFLRYQEPTFFRIVKVETVPVEEGTDRKVRAWVEKVFRGRRYPKLVDMHRVSYKSDYLLVPKAKEAELWERVNNTKLEERIIPSTAPFPPLLSEMLKEEMKKMGKPVVEPALKLIVNQKRDNFYRTATESEVPTVKVEPYSGQLFDINK